LSGNYGFLQWKSQVFTEATNAGASGMTSWRSILTLAHLIGLVLAVGCATAKLRLLLRCRADPAFVPTYVSVARPVTHLIILGLALLTVSGLGWILVGYPVTPLLVVKLILVGAVWVLGPIIDNVVEPKFQRLAPDLSESASPAFMGILRRYLLLETVATGLFYVIVVMWVLA